jgi:hypothetical protein
MEHFCTEHNCSFYRNEKNGKVWYAHKIKDSNKYCNEPQESALVKAALDMGAEKVTPQKPVQSIPQPPQSKSNPVKEQSNTMTPNPINGAELGMVMNNIKDLFIAGQLENMFTGTDITKVQTWYRKHILFVVDKS